VNWKLKISDLLVAFIWLSFLLGTCSQLINSASPAVFNFFAALCFCSIVLLRVKLKLGTQSTSSFLTTIFLNLITSIVFFEVSSFATAGLFVFVSANSIFISLILLVARLASGFHPYNSMTTLNRLLELLAPSSCSALYFACFIAHVVSNRLTSEWFPLFIGGLIFLLTVVFVVLFYRLEKAFKK
jgi:hypothetical protein